MEAGVATRRGLWIALAVVLLIRIPFLNQAIQGDDHTYLAEAAHALIEPLHPAHTMYVYQGVPVDLRGHPHPPLDAWVLAGLIAIFGGVKEIPFHAAYIVFSLIAAWAMWSLARRFSPQPLWATLLFLAAPVFVINGTSLETDLPFVAFWLAAIALFVSGRIAASCLAMALATMTAYQAVLLTPILGVYVWLFHRRDRARWAAVVVPPVVVVEWQLFERVSTGALPAAVLTGYLGIYETLEKKLMSAAGLTIHFWFLIFPLLIPGALVLAWRKRRDRDTQFLLGWIAIFFGGALAIFFAGSARYLLPMVAPVALLASRLRARWLAIGFALQMALALGLAAANYQHWDAYRQFALSQRPLTASHRLWIDGEWGLRYYFEKDGGLPLLRTQRLRPDDVVVSAALGHSVEVRAPKVTIAAVEVRPSVPLRIFGLESHSGYSTVGQGFWPFGIGAGLVDRVRADRIVERHPTLEYLSTSAPEAAEQIAIGIDADHWMHKTAEVALKSPAEAKPLRVEFYISPAAAARRMTLRLDGREVASQSYPGPGAYVLASAPVRPAGPTAAVQLEVDRTFSPPGDLRDLGVVVTAVGFK
jgi:hypothetical protein